MKKKLFQAFAFLAALGSSLTAQAQWSGFDPLPPEPGQRGIVVLTSRPEGAARFSGNGNYTPGATAHINATRTHAVWKFKGWVNEAGDTVSRSTAVSLEVVAGITRLAACYTEDTDTFRVMLKVPEGIYTSGTGTYDNTQHPYIYCGTRANLEFQNWTRNGEVVSTHQGFTYNRRDGEKDVELVANFAFNPTLPAEPDTARLRHTVYIQCDPDIGGTVNYPDGTTMLEGDELTLTAQPARDFVFTEWLRDGEPVSDVPSYRLRMGRTDTYLTARFRYAPDRPEEPLPPVQQTYSLYAGTVTTYPARGIYLPLSLENTDVIDRIDCSLRLPAGFDILPDSTLTTARTEGCTVTVNTRRIDKDSLAVDVSLRGTKPFAYNNGAVAYLYVTTADTLAVGTYEVNIADVTGYIGTSTRHPSSHNGTIIIEKPIPTHMLGDVNGDGRINIQDVNLLSRYILGFRYDSFIEANADINGDGRINIFDVDLLLLNIILSHF